MIIKQTLSLMLFCVTGCHAQANTQPTFTPQNITLQDEQAARKHLWSNLPWSGDNKPYQQIRQQLEKADAGGQNMDALRVKYGILAQQHPQDPRAQFRWSYAAALSITPTTGGGTAQGRMFGVAEALARAPSPRTYDYLREQFLIEVWYSRTKGLEQLGQRLLEHSPNDYPVQSAYIRVLKWSPLPGASNKALSMAQILVKQNPQKASAYALLGGVYTDRWYNKHNKDDADKALAASQEYLRRTPPTYTQRQDVLLTMSIIKRDIASGN